MSVYQDPESGTWVAEVADLPGCTGVGDSAEEAVVTAKGFIRAWLEEAAAQGWDIPQPTVRAEASGKFVARLPRSLHARLQELAVVEGTSLNQLVVAMLAAAAGMGSAAVALTERYPTTGAHSARVSDRRARR